MNFLPKQFEARLRDVYLFTWGYFAFHVFAMFMMRVFLNSESFFSNFDFWLRVLVIEHALIFTFYFLAKKFVHSYSGWLVALSSLALGALRTFITTSMGIAAGLDHGINLTLQMITGALFELVMVAVWSSINGAFRDHQSIVRELVQIRNSILGYRENAEEILAEEQEKLLKLTQDSLLPQIKLIEDAVAEGSTEISSRWQVAHELKGLIYNQVRPLSESLRTSAKLLVKPAPNTPGQFRAVILIPRKFRITNSIFPKLNTLTIALSFLATPLWTLNESWVPISAIFAAPYFAILYALKKFTQNWPRLNAWLGVPTLIIFSLLPVLPAYTAAVLFFGNLNAAVLYGLTLCFASMIVFLSLALLDSLDYGSRKYRLALEEQNRELAVEMTLFEQQLWAARKNWSLVIHGTVQASLTAALTRLNAADANDNTLALARKDLDRAVAALTNPPTAQLKFSAAIKELADTWQGVCDIGVSIPADLKKIIAKDARLSMCINEICKEAISNAVRHGNAHYATIAIRNLDGKLLELSVSNDGLPPSAQLRKGLGSTLLDELTVDWQLTNTVGAQTTLLAHLPFLSPQA